MRSRKEMPRDAHKAITANVGTVSFNASSNFVTGPIVGIR